MRFGVPLLDNVLGKGGSIIWYVRPSGSTYGTSDGRSYDNAFSGFAGISTTNMRAGDTVLIDGTHSEFFPASKVVNGVTYKAYDTGSPPTLTGSSVRNICMDLTGKSNVRIESMTMTAAVVSCLNLDGSTGIYTKNLTVSNSGNQGIQHLGASTATHENLTASGCTDDGVSVHDSGIVYIIGTSTFSGNNQNINNIGSSKVYLSGSYTFSGTSTYDLYCTNADTEGSCEIVVSSSGTVRNINSDIGAKMTLTGVTVTGTTSISASTGTGTIVATDCVFQGALTLAMDGTLTATGCRISSISVSQGAYNLVNCRVVDEINTSSGASVYARGTFFDGTGTTAALVDINSGASVDISNCLFKGMAANQFGLAIRTGATVTNAPNNNTFYGAATVGRGLFAQIDLTSNNNIFKDLAIGYFRSAGTSILNNCCFHGNTTDKSGTVTSNNEVTGNPNFTDPSNNDFSLGASSSCIDTGTTLSSAFESGIVSATWGTSSTAPVVTRGTQSGAWDIGAWVKI